MTEPAAPLSRRSAAARWFPAAAAALGCLLAPVLVGVLFSRVYWGYFFLRPDIPGEAEGMAAVDLVVPVATETDAEGRRRFFIDVEAVLPDALRDGRADPYYCLEERILLHLDRAGILPPSFHRGLAARAALDGLYETLERSGELIGPYGRYNRADFLTGVVVAGTDADGDRLVFVGATGEEVSNDHRPCYEFVLRPAGGGTLEIAESQIFFYDVAGIEGLEWYAVALLVGPLLVGGSGGLLLLFVHLRRRAARAITA